MLCGIDGSLFSLRLPLVQTAPFGRRMPVLAGYPKIRMPSISLVRGSRFFAVETIGLVPWKVTMLYSPSPRCISVLEAASSPPLSLPFPPVVGRQISSYDDSAGMENIFPSNVQFVISHGMKLPRASEIFGLRNSEDDGFAAHSARGAKPYTNDAKYKSWEGNSRKIVRFQGGADLGIG